MLYKACANCDETNTAHANFCSACGAQDFLAITTKQSQDPNQPSIPNPESLALNLSTTRLIILSIVTSGVYFFYWLYLTWKQLHNESEEVHYPVWHALSFFVPIYGLFRLHRHILVIRERALLNGIDTSLSTGMSVVLAALYWLLVITGAGAQDFGFLIILGFIRLALVTTVMVWAQSTLNKYWLSSRGQNVGDMPFRGGEVGFVLSVVLLQLTSAMILG